jgi:hypothetical protein
VADLLFVVVVVGFFAIATLVVVACERLVGSAPIAGAHRER